MHVVTVTFEIDPDHLGPFMEAMTAQAATSLAREPGCVQFEVCIDPDQPAQVFLYEIYTDARAFSDHLASDHFIDFDRRVTPWVRAKDVRRFERLGDD